MATRRPSGARPTAHPKAGTTNHTPAHRPTATEPGRPHRLTHEPHGARRGAGQRQRSAHVADAVAFDVVQIRTLAHVTMARRPDQSEFVPGTTSSPRPPSHEPVDDRAPARLEERRQDHDRQQRQHLTSDSPYFRLCRRPRATARGAAIRRSRSSSCSASTTRPANEPGRIWSSRSRTRAPTTSACVPRSCSTT